MPFFISPPPPVEIPKTNVEFVNTDEASDVIDIATELRNIELDEDLFESVYIKDKFNTLVNSWESNTLLESSVSRIIEDESFQRIVEMGEKAIPLIINEIDKNPSTLVWALNIITNSTMRSYKRLTVTEACKMWVKSWKKAVHPL